MYTYTSENGNKIELSDRELEILERLAKERNNKTVLKKVAKTEKINISNEEMKNLKVDNEKASIGKEIFKICGILIAEAGTIVASSQLGLGIPLPIIFIVAAGLIKSSATKMYKIANEKENNHNEEIKEASGFKL